MLQSTHAEPTPIDGIAYYMPPSDFIITGRDGSVAISWDFPIPLSHEDFAKCSATPPPSYDQIGSGMYRALRTRPDCLYAVDYARVLKEGYPHIIAEIGGEAIMLDVKEVDTPYLDRKINLLRIMGLLEPDNAHLWREIGKTYMEKGSRLEASHSAVHSWYAAERFLKQALELDARDSQIKILLAETHYMLGHYAKAVALWEQALLDLEDTQKQKVAARIASIQTGNQPRVPVVDYLTALAVAFEQHQNEAYYEAAAIIEDVLLDEEFCKQYPLTGVFQFLEQCYRAVNMTDKADDVRRQISC